MAVTPLAPGLLYRVCLPDQFGFETTTALPETTDMLGQERAEEAILFGIGIKRDGYNLFALGPNGTGFWSLAVRARRWAGKRLSACFKQQPGRSYWSSQARTNYRSGRIKIMDAE